MDNERSGGSTRRMDMTDMDSRDSDPLGESSADAVSAAEAGTSTTVGGQGSGAMQQAQGDLQMRDAIGDDMIGDDGGAQASAARASASTPTTGKRSGRIPDYALEMIAEHLRKRGHDKLSADDLDSALSDAGFTVTPDPWHGYQPRSGPSLAEGAITQQQQQRAGGFVTANPLGNVGSITLADTEAYRQSQQDSNVAQSSAVSVAPALSQISSDEGMGSNVASIASTDHPQPRSGLETSGGETSAAATGPAAGMGDMRSSEPADLSAAAFGASADDSAMSDEGPVQPPANVDFEASDGDGTTDTTAASFSASGDVQAEAPTLGDRSDAPSDTDAMNAASYASGDNQDMAADTASGNAMGSSTMPDRDTMSGVITANAATGDNALTDAGAATADPMAASSKMDDGAAMGATEGTSDGVATSSGGTGPVDAATTDMPVMPVTQVVGAGVGTDQQVAPHLRLSSGVEFAFGEKQEILIGREDPVSDIFPDVDLTGFGGEEGGVSRRHARIIRDGDTYLLEDLNSTNYTKLNGVKLIPKIPQAMRDGDHVSFGKVEGTFHLYK